jgi:hypothetical protein
MPESDNGRFTKVNGVAKETSSAAAVPGPDTGTPDQNGEHLAEPVALWAAAKSLIGAVKRLRRQKLPTPPAPDSDVIRAAVHAVYTGGNLRAQAANVAQHAARQYDVATGGLRKHLEKLAGALDSVERETAKIVSLDQRDIRNGPQYLQVPGERVPWSALHVIEIPVLVALSVFFMGLGWCAIRFFVASSGVLPADQTWVVASGGILAALGLELVPVGLSGHEQKRRYLLGLLIPGVVAWALWIAGFVMVYGRAIYQPPVVGGEPQADTTVVGVIQLGLQLAGEILCSAAAIVAVEIITEKHGGLTFITHPERRRRETVLGRVQKLLARVGLAHGEVLARILELQSATVLAEQRAVALLQLRYRQLTTEVAILYPQAPGKQDINQQLEGLDSVLAASDSQADQQ